MLIKCFKSVDKSYCLTKLAHIKAYYTHEKWQNATMLLGCNNNWFFSDNCLIIGHLVLIGIIYHYKCELQLLIYERTKQEWFYFAYTPNFVR